MSTKEATTRPLDAILSDLGSGGWYDVENRADLLAVVDELWAAAHDQNVPEELREECKRAHRRICS